MEALKQLLTEINVSPAERDMIESIFIRLVWTLTDASVAAEHALDIFQDTSKRLMENLGSLSEDATHASLIVKLNPSWTRIYAHGKHSLYGSISTSTFLRTTSRLQRNGALSSLSSHYSRYLQTTVGKF